MTGRTQVTLTPELLGVLNAMAPAMRRGQPSTPVLISPIGARVCTVLNPDRLHEVPNETVAILEAAGYVRAKRRQEGIAVIHDLTRQGLRALERARTCMPTPAR